MDNDRLNQPAEEHEDVEPVDGSVVAMNALRRVLKHPAFIAVVPFVLALVVQFVLANFGREIHRPLNIVMFGLFGVLMIAGSVRELKGNRRPMWLATWMAAGIISITSFFGAVSSAYAYSHTSHSPSDRTYISAIVIKSVFQFVFLVALGLWASRNTPKLRKVTIFGFGAMIPLIVGEFMFLKSGVAAPSGHWIQWLTIFGAIAKIGELVVWIAVALRVFALQDDSNVYYGALFLYAVSVFHLRSGGMNMDYVAFYTLLPIAAVLVFAFAQNYKIKLGALVTAVIISALWPPVFLLHDWKMAIYWIFAIAVDVIPIILLPVIARYWQSREVPKSIS